MSSGFVAGGQDSDWVKAQQEIEDKTRAKNAEGKQHDGKSLYEVLQNNKAAKQEAFEESMRLKNQFRSLDEDEAEFLDSVLESTRAQEAAVKKDTAEQLEGFRKQQEAAEKARLEGPDDVPSIDAIRPPAQEDSWTAKKKRRREKDSETIVGTKVRRLSSKDDQSLLKPTNTPKEEREAEVARPKTGEGKVEGLASRKESPMEKPSSKAESKPSGTSLLGLGDYSSDDD